MWDVVCGLHGRCRKNVGCYPIFSRICDDGRDELVELEERIRRTKLSKEARTKADEPAPKDEKPEKKDEPEASGEDEEGEEYDEPLEREPPKLDEGREEGAGEEYERDGDDDRDPPKLLRRCARATSATKNVNNSVKQVMKRITAS